MKSDVNEGNETEPVWVRAQIALKNEGTFSQVSGTRESDILSKKIIGRRSARTIFNNYRTDKKLYRDHVLSSNFLLSESATNDITATWNDIFFLRMRTPELDEFCWDWSQKMLSDRDYYRSAGIDLPIENDHRKTIKDEMSVRTHYLNKIWHNSLYAMSELGMEIPNWCKILPYTPLVNAFHGTNRDDEDIGERLLSILEEKYPELHTELIASNPFHSPRMNTLGRYVEGTKWPSISDIISRLESGEPVDQDWENNFVVTWLPSEDDDEMEEIDDDDMEDVLKKDNLDIDLEEIKEYWLRRLADNDEITGAWSMNREELILASATRTEKMNSEMIKLGRTNTAIPRLTDWTTFVIENVNFFKLDDARS